MRLNRWIVAGLLIAGGCESDGAVPRPGGAPDVAAPDGEPYRAPPGFPLPFQTVVPEGFLPRPEVEGEAAGVRFVWRPAEGRDSAFVYVRVMDEGVSEGRARETVRTAAERLRVPGDRTELEPRDELAWAVVEYPLVTIGSFGERVRGWVALGHRQGRWFYVISQAPVPEWPRFEPQAERLLSAWRWMGPDGSATSAGLEPR